MNSSQQKQYNNKLGNTEGGATGRIDQTMEWSNSCHPEVTTANHFSLLEEDTEDQDIVPETQIKDVKVALGMQQFLAAERQSVTTGEGDMLNQEDTQPVQVRMAVPSLIPNLTRQNTELQQLRVLPEAGTQSGIAADCRNSKSNDVTRNYSNTVNSTEQGKCQMHGGNTEAPLGLHQEAIVDRTGLGPYCTKGNACAGSGTSKIWRNLRLAALDIKVLLLWGF